MARGRRRRAPVPERVGVLGPRPIADDGRAIDSELAVFQCLVRRAAGGIRPRRLRSRGVRLFDGRLHPSAMAGTGPVEEADGSDSVPPGPAGIDTVSAADQRRARALCAVRLRAGRTPRRSDGTAGIVLRYLPIFSVSS